ncbi:helix-turn-helix transcriptional regulator [Roseospira visakhapatnamensis]|uniref:Putative DNA-binding transcriptional regulator AlpA n=1 Tax=Roseospira visakhapatnamensis TaxID=390880 RepID=A0A7W6RE05_9PROT|nr:transcriptional regulator [Roseospira visakhapatnamensis]MBB4266815.1 putative DNA-binding transcriptional regulator AlpA [Roseospira visakhapatnamensis]
MKDVPSPLSDTALVPARVVRAELGGISDMTLWRWLHRPDLEFPEPVLISRRRYWRRQDLETWKRSRFAPRARQKQQGEP